MSRKDSARIESGYRIIGEAKAYLQVPTFDSLQKMTVKELLSVPAIERLISIKAINFFSKFATQEGILELVSAITMIPLHLCEGVVQVSGGHVKDTVEARSALLILKASGSITERRSKDSLFSFLVGPKSLFFDAIFAALNYITSNVTEAKSLKERYALINQYMDSLDAMMLALEYIADTSVGTETLLDVLTKRYSMDTNVTPDSCNYLNPFIVLLDIAYVNGFLISLLCKNPPITKCIAIKINDFLLHTRFADFVFYYLLPEELVEALQISPASESISSQNLSGSSILPASFIEVHTWLHAKSIKSDQARSGAPLITEDALAHAMELLCHVMASGNILLIGSIVRYLPAAAQILFSPELLCTVSLHTLKLICTFSSTSIGMILRTTRLYVSEILGTDALEPRNSSADITSKDPFTRSSLHEIIEYLANVIVEGERTTDAEAPPKSSGIIRSGSQSRMESIKFDQSLLPAEVESKLVPIYSIYIGMLSRFIQHQMPKVVSGRSDSAYLARISITMEHLASVFCILDDIGKMLYLAANSNSAETPALYADGDTLDKRARFDYCYCGRIPHLGTISTTCPESISIHETYIIKGRILSPSPLSIFACVFPPPKNGTNPLLTLQLMLFNIRTGQQTIIKHYVTRILSSIIVFSADSAELFKRVVSDIKLSAFLSSISLKKNRNPFCNLVCEMLLRVCLRCNDTCWRLYRERLAGYYRNDDVDTTQDLAYPLSLSNAGSLSIDKNTDKLALLRFLMASSDFVTYVESVLEADHNKYVRIRNSTVLRHQ